MNAILKYLPVISAFLIFIGYINYTGYYRFFDIEIVSYLTTGELLLSFLPLTKGIIVLFIFISIIVISELVSLNTAKNDSKDKLEHSRGASLSIFMFASNYKALRENLKEKRWKTLWDLLRIAFEIVGCVVGIASILFFILFFLVGVGLIIDSKPYPYDNFGLIVTLSLFWFMLLFDVIHRAETRDRLKNSSMLYGIFFIVCFLYFITIWNKNEALRVLKGDPEKQVSFIYDSKTVKTDSNLVYVGKTAEYLFIRDRTTKVNRIFKVSEISNLEIKTLRK